MAYVITISHILIVKAFFKSQIFVRNYQCWITTFLLNDINSLFRLISQPMVIKSFSWYCDNEMYAILNYSVHTTRGGMWPRSLVSKSLLSS